MKFLVTGASGLLGRAVVEKAKSSGHEVKGLAFTRAGGDLVKLDLHDTKAFRALCEEYKPDVIIHAAAERRPDVAEKDPEAAKRLNITVSRQIAEVARDLDIVLIYISTDYVFPGEAPPGGYEPDSPTEPLQLYGESKLAGEQEVLQVGKAGRAVVLRVPVLYGKASPNSESAINILIDVVKAQKPGKMDDWSPRYPTNVADVARVLLDIGQFYRDSADKELPPILQFSGSQGHPITKYGISLLFSRILGIEGTEKLLEPVRQGNLPGETRRPRDCHLSNAKLESLGIDTSEGKSFESWFEEYLKQ
ncbi:NAD(P)-binding protein [Cystobasidium minutum MCA 4210]|uniref:NAD(P)-binding protein n=1 Tax=Cystobasidium minutum MCA 4210 TaxID=1397322 RepID=UPI0034CFC9F0|eukprot:jgi/Rhomi1/185194/estExt_fgenesh1_pm.C_20204